MNLKVIINGQEIEAVSPKEMAAILISFLFREAKYMSFEALVNGIQEFMDFLVDYMKEIPITPKNSASMKRMIKMLNRWDKQLIKVNNRDENLKWLYTTMLNLEGLALIR